MIVTNNIKYLHVILIKLAKDLFEKNFKSLKKETEEFIRWKDLLCSYTSKINIVNMPILPKSIYGFNKIPFKFQRNSLQTFKDEYSTTKQTYTIKELLEVSPSQISSCTVWNSNINYMVHKVRQVYQWNWIRDLEVIPHTYGNYIFGKIIQWGNESIFLSC